MSYTVHTGTHCKQIHISIVSNIIKSSGIQSTLLTDLQSATVGSAAKPCQRLQTYGMFIDTVGSRKKKTMSNSWLWPFSNRSVLNLHRKYYRPSTAIHEYEHLPMVDLPQKHQKKKNMSALRSVNGNRSESARLYNTLKFCKYLYVFTSKKVFNRPTHIVCRCTEYFIK